MRVPTTLAVGIAVLLTAIPILSFAADPTPLRFRHLGREDGLSQSYVNAIAQDRNGFLWFGTQEGLNRYDGYRFRLYEHDPDDPGTLASDLVRSLTTDTDGVLWVGTDGGGVARYDPATDSFTRFMHDPNDVASLSDDSVRVVTTGPDGAIWIGTDYAGLCRLDPATGVVTRFPLVADSVGVFAIAFDGSGVPIAAPRRVLPGRYGCGARA